MIPEEVNTESGLELAEEHHPRIASDLLPEWPVAVQAVILGIAILAQGTITPRPKTTVVALAIAAGIARDNIERNLLAEVTRWRILFHVIEPRRHAIGILTTTDLAAAAVVSEAPRCLHLHLPKDTGAGASRLNHLRGNDRSVITNHPDHLETVPEIQSRRGDIDAGLLTSAIAITIGIGLDLQAASLVPTDLLLHLKVPGRSLGGCLDRARYPDTIPHHGPNLREALVD
ncbi:hypothetical protein ED733_002549 [Metarhizium rileyi]|uniref:Uncharacterized protein n=1 Tax=Metarhizium rileyi (strain RCEF 4871) TaxID=1649241 RepID=A0A5C6G7G0_METRR|nr:hypothetical protein ED733_002549 [Metarhizium rileyi]